MQVLNLINKDFQYTTVFFVYFIYVVFLLWGFYGLTVSDTEREETVSSA